MSAGRAGNSIAWGLRARGWMRVKWIAALALAAPLAAAAAQAPEARSTTVTIFRWLNFVLVFGVGGWWVGRKLKAAFRKKADRIEETIAAAESARRQAQERLRAAEMKLAAVEREAADLLERGRRESAAEVERIRALAVEEAERVARAAQAELAAAERAAVTRMRETAVALTIAKARALAAERVTTEIDHRLVQRFTEVLGVSGGKA